METLSNISVSFRSTLVIIFPGWDNKDAVNAAERITKEAEKAFPGAAVKAVYDNCMQSKEGKAFVPVRRAHIAISGVYEEEFMLGISSYLKENETRQKIEDMLDSLIRGEEDAYRTNTLMTVNVRKLAG